SVSKGENDLKFLTLGGFVGGLIALCQNGFQIISDSFQYWFKTSNMIFGFGLGFSPALIAAGYIVGVNIAVSIFIGILLGWIAGVPILTLVNGIPAGNSIT